MAHLLSQIPYQPPPHEKVMLPERVVRDHGHPKITEPRYIPTPF